MKVKILLFFFISVFLYVVRLLWDAGVFKSLETIHFKDCKAKIPMEGPEDMALLTKSQWVVISSDPRSEDEAKAGDLAVYDYEKAALVDINRLNFPKDFFPHGLDVLAQENGDSLISVVNQNSIATTRIEFFEFDKTKRVMKWIKSIDSPQLVAANDLILLGENEFLYTRDFDTKDKHKTRIQQYLRQSTGSIWHFKDGQFTEVINGLFFANGMAYDRASSTLYVAEMLGRKVHSYLWNNSNLIPVASLNTPHGIDNLTLTENAVYGAAHPKLLDLKKMRDHRQFKSPSAVLELTKDLSKVNIIYQDNGSEIAASSVALKVSPQEIMVGSVFDGHFLHCQTEL